MAIDENSLLALIQDLQNDLAAAEQLLLSGAADESVLNRLQDALLDMRRFKPGSMNMTGSGSAPQPAYEFCDVCRRYRRTT